MRESNQDVITDSGTNDFSKKLIFLQKSSVQKVARTTENCDDETAASLDNRMIASFAGRLPVESSGDENCIDAKSNNNSDQLQSTESLQNRRRQILASIGQPPPRLNRLNLGWNRRGVGPALRSVSCDRGNDNDRPNFGATTFSDDEDDVAQKRSMLTANVDQKFRDDHSRREFIEKLRLFERLTVQTKNKTSEPNPSLSSNASNPAKKSSDSTAGATSLASKKSACQSVPLARRPPPPTPSAPPKPPKPNCPEIENRLRFFDAAFGRHSNLRERRLENLVSNSSNSSPPTSTPTTSTPSTPSAMSASVSSAVMMHHQQQRLLPGGASLTADDSAIIYHHQQQQQLSNRNSPALDQMSYSMTAASPSPAKAAGRIDVLNRISNQLLLSTTTAVMQQQQQPQDSQQAVSKPTTRTMSSSLQATEAELRRELEHLDLMLSDIKDKATKDDAPNEVANGNPIMSPLASLARERRHSVATGAMAGANGGTRIPRINAVTIIPQTASSRPVNNSTAMNLPPADLRAEIQNFRKAPQPQPSSNSEPLAQTGAPISADGTKDASTELTPKKLVEQSGDHFSNSNSPSPIRSQVVNGSGSEHSSPMLQQRSDQSPSPSSLSTANKTQRRVVLVKTRVPITNSAITSSLGDNNGSARGSPAPATVVVASTSQPILQSQQQQVQLEADKVSLKQPAVEQSNMLSPSSSELSSTSNDQKLGNDCRTELPPPPTPSPPSRDNLSSDASTPPPPVQEQPKLHNGITVINTFDTSNQLSPSLTPSTSNSDSNGALAAVGNFAPSTAVPATLIPSSPLPSAHKHHQQILRDISTLRHCLIDIETQQQNILQEVSALKAEASAVGEVESLREAIRAAELRFELERERANARLVQARNKAHAAARELQHLEQQRMMATPSGGDPADDESDEAALVEAHQQLAALQEDVADADFELVEAETRYESERERLMTRLSAANDAALSAKTNSVGMIGGNSSYDYWIKRLTEHYRQLDTKRQLVERNLAKLQVSFTQTGTNNQVANLSLNSSNFKENPSDTTLSTIHVEKDESLVANDSMAAKINDGQEAASNSGDSQSYSAESSTNNQAESTSTASRPISFGDEQQQQQKGNNEVVLSVTSPTTVKLRHSQNGQHKANSIRMIPAHERPRTLFLPQPDNVALDLREHLDALSHDWRSCSHVNLSTDGASCRGWLHKLSSRMPSIVRPWSRRWFVFDRQQRSFFYFSDTNEHHARGDIPFTSILDVYVETASSGSASTSTGHRNLRPPNSCSNLLIVVQTVDRRLILAAPSPQAARIWVDILCTGAAGNQSYESSSPPSDQQFSLRTLPARS